MKRLLAALWLALAALPAIAGAPAIPPGPDQVARKAAAANAAAIAAQNPLQTPPATFAAAFQHPVNVYRAANGRATTDADPRAATPAIKAIFDGIAAGTTGVTYADRSKADNSAAGTAPGTAKQGIFSAANVCYTNSAYAACATMVRAGDYGRIANFLNIGTSQAGGANTFPKPTALICYGGPCIISDTVLGLSWSVNSTYSNVYQTTRNNVLTDLNLLANDSSGDPNKFAWQTSIANVAACTADCRFNDGSIEYVHRADGAAPTDANMRLMLTSDILRLPSNNNSFFMSGFTVLGGNFGSFQDTETPVKTRDIVITDSYFGFPAAYPAQTTNGNVVSIDNLNGLVALFRVTGTNGGADIWNAHASSGGSEDWLMVDTVARNAGRGTNSQSNNCPTGHDGSASNYAVRWLIINGTCTNAAGGALRTIGYTYVLAYNYLIDGDRGDVASGGTVQSACFDAETGSVFWLVDSRALHCLNSIVTTSAATIYLRRFDDGGGLRTGAGTVAGF